jgi:pimeloyl-ACP methyl ester carboxylesterase
MATSKSQAAGGSADWDQFEDALLSAGTRGKPGTQAARTLEGFDEAELQVLRRLAMRSQVERSRSAPRGNVVFLHGITGADLAAVKKGDQDDIWINFPRLILGRIADLKLRADGAGEADPKLTVVATRINKRYYARAMVALRARWNAEPFAYDWRKDIDTASDELAAMIRRRFPGQPVHLVAHSMGGLVSRNMIRRHPTLWEEMRGTDLAAGGRLVMLGTPNYGSFAIVQAMTGEDQMMSMLEKFDIKHDMSELLSITNSFLGSYQLLPAPSKLPASLNALYLADTWSEHTHVSQAHLNRAHQFFSDLENSATIDASRMVYIAGCGQPTIDSMTIDGRGDFEYTLSRAGDGRFDLHRRLGRAGAASAAERGADQRILAKPQVLRRQVAGPAALLRRIGEPCQVIHEYEIGGAAVLAHARCCALQGAQRRGPQALGGTRLQQFIERGQHLLVARQIAVHFIDVEGRHAAQQPE